MIGYMLIGYIVIGFALGVASAIAFYKDMPEQFKTIEPYLVVVAVTFLWLPLLPVLRDKYMETKKR